MKQLEQLPAEPTEMEQQISSDNQYFQAAGLDQEQAQKFKDYLTLLELKEKAKDGNN